MASKKPSSRKRSATTTGLDAYLQEHGKQLRTGDQLHLRLVKGPNIQTSPDPVDPKADPEQFPAILKFPVSTAPPDFTQHPWNTARLYQQDVPKHADSDDEEAAKDQSSLRRRRRRVYATPRQWIVQENVDFLESMLEKHSATTTNNSNEPRASTSRYEGTPEHNPSRFFLFSLQQGGAVTVQPVPSPNATITCTQPEVRGTVASLSQAADAAAILRRPQASHSRLLAKVTASSSSIQKEDEGDDVMADVAYTHRKGGGGAARKELLQTMADGIAVSNDGVLGGTDDAAFGARHQRFGNLQASEQANAGSGGPTTERGADGAAMADDFYARDVGKEFEEMDYDPNEGEFDDDDVDVGESEIHNIGDDDAGGDYEEEEDEEEDDNLAEEVTEGAAGLATAKGFKLLLAKARGEAPAEPEPGAADGNDPNARKRSASQMSNHKHDDRDHRSKIRNATTRKVVGIHALVQNAAAASPSSAASASAPAAAAAAMDVQQVDENGLRVITLEAVRREIWLNHGSIGMDRLSKIFSVKKKVPNKNERKDLFKKAVKELCNMNDDPVKGKLLVLKQHYAHMD